MKNLSILFCFCLLVSLTTSCTEELADSAVVVELSPTEKAQILLNNTPHEIIFAALHIDHEDYSLTGLVIDKESRLKKVQVTNNDFIDISNNLIVSLDMDRLVESSTVIKELDILETADYLRKSKLLNHYQAVKEADETENKSHVYLSYRSSQETEEYESCGCGEGASTDLVESYDMYRQTIISTTGKYSQVNSSTKTANIISWLQSFEAEFGDL